MGTRSLVQQTKNSMVSYMDLGFFQIDIYVGINKLQTLFNLEVSIPQGCNEWKPCYLESAVHQ